MATNQSSWKVGQWTTPTTTVTTQPVPSEVTAESKSQISHNIPGQFASFIQDEYPTFIEFVKAYYKSQEFQGGPVDIAENIDQYIKNDAFKHAGLENATIICVTKRLISLLCLILPLFTTLIVAPPEASSKAGGDPAPVEVKTCPSVPGPIATGLPEASHDII